MGWGTYRGEFVDRQPHENFPRHVRRQPGKVIEREVLLGHGGDGTDHVDVGSEGPVAPQHRAGAVEVRLAVEHAVAGGDVREEGADAAEAGDGLVDA